MAAVSVRKSALILGAAASLLVVTPAFARGGGGGHGGGGHSSGGHSSGGHSSGGHSSGGGHVSTPHSSGSGGHAAPHYSAPSSGYRGTVGGVHGASPMRGPSVGYRNGYIGGGRGAYVAGGRVPHFYGGPHGRLWWGPHYGWRVPLYWGGYYSPYVGYWGVSYWVTDWVMLDYLAAEEARRMAYAGPNAVAVPVTSAAIDGGVREELRAQIAEILAMPASPVGNGAGAGNTLVVNDPRVVRALAASHHVFVVSRAVTVADRTNGGTCSVTQGDLLRTSAPIPSGQSYADVRVAASKHSSCAPGAIVALPIADLVQFESALIERVGRGVSAANATETEPETAPAPGAPAPSAPTPTPTTTPAPPANGVSI